jgi:Leucine-rich repeat (LRR) protein
VSLSPSIGNWNHKCKSHYFIRNDKVIWASEFTDSQIEKVVKRDKIELDNHMNETFSSNKTGIINWVKRILKMNIK